ncbi:uncharacterized protein VTP21DRAFT_7121 [Calcarisporiella thermophila]|uniref:uncharacterized protein n=1 Tax=Calcarisporiella thermophila TaxID=911321 RepID=UPI0037421DFD
MSKQKTHATENGTVICEFCGAKIDGKRHSSNKKPTTKWRKLLYVKQDYPDNYVDATFLEELQKNVNVRNYDYWTVVVESNVVSQQISSIMVFVAVFKYLYTAKLSAQSLIWIGSALSAVGYVFWDLNIGRADPTYIYRRKKTAKGAILFFVTLLGLSPILKTLTSATSDDTIWALTVCLFLANLLFHDYSSGNITNIGFPGSVSTNAAIFASVLLASRLTSDLAVFAFMAFAIEWFALFSIFRRLVKNLSLVGNVILTLLLFITATVLFATISSVVVVLYVAAILFITFGCPFWLIQIQKYKNKIHGPWDEARPKILHK